MFGIPDSWDSSIGVIVPIPSYGGHHPLVTWSPCSQFVVVKTKEALEIRDALTFELLSTLPSTGLDTIAYSPDGRSLACSSGTFIGIWDIQTGGVVKQIQCNKLFGNPLVWLGDKGLIGTMEWSLDGGSISTMVWLSCTVTIDRYDVTSGTVLSPITLQSRYKPHLWAHGECFRVMTTAKDYKVYTIDIFEVGLTQTKIESFLIQLEEYYCQIEAFSPTTYHISVLIPGNNNRLLIMDICNSRGLLDAEGHFDSHCFSSNGSLFAASWLGSLHIWKYDNSRYIPWRKFEHPYSEHPPVLFSPASLSILCSCSTTLKLWRLDGPSVNSHPYRPLGMLLPPGIHLATAHGGEHTITLTNILLQTPSQFIDTGIEITQLVLTGNILLVVGSEAVEGLEEVEGSTVVVAWLLTEEGLVKGAGRRAGWSDSIWTVSTQRGFHNPLFSVEHETAIINSGETLHTYNTRTGEVLKPAEDPVPSNDRWYSLADIFDGFHDLYGGSDRVSWDHSQPTLKEGWIKDHEGKHRLWLPAEWKDGYRVEWFPGAATIQFRSSEHKPIIIKPY